MDMFDKVFKCHEKMVQKRCRDECVYCTETARTRGTSTRANTVRCAKHTCTLRAGFRFTAEKLFSRRSYQCISGVIQESVVDVASKMFNNATREFVSRKQSPHAVQMILFRSKLSSFPTGRRIPKPLRYTKKIQPIGFDLVIPWVKRDTVKARNAR